MVDMVILKTICVTISSSSDRICLLIVFNIFSYLRWNVRFVLFVIYISFLILVVVSSSRVYKSLFRKVCCHYSFTHITHELLVNDEC